MKYPDVIFATEKIGSNGIRCLDYKNEDDDVKYIRADLVKLQNTSSNSDYAAAVKNLINSEVDCVQTKNGAYVNLDGVIDCLNRALHDFA